MRLEHLFLKRYGRFTDQRLDFERSVGAPDLHIVFGPNEAGKSTLRSAVVDLLYGFPSRTSYDFLHEKSTLQLDATLSTSAGTQALSRIKRAKNSLLGPDGQVLAESQMAGMLGGLSRDGYLNMFSVDEDLLEEGSESILRSEGDLGELLFSSAAGLAALSGELAALREEADAFYKRPGRVFELAELKKQLIALKAEIKAKDIPASQFEALRKKLAGAEAAHQQALEERDKHNVERFRVQALLDCEPLYLEANALRSALEAQPPCESVPVGWYEEAQSLALALSSGEGKLEQLRSHCEELKESLAALQGDPAALAMGARLDRLVEDDLEADYRAAQRTHELKGVSAALEAEISAGLVRLGLDPSMERDKLQLSTVRRARIKPLIEQQALLKASLLTANQELERAEATLARAQSEHDATAEWGDYAALGECLEDARTDGDDRERTRLAEDVRQQQARVDQALAALEGWQGTLDELMSQTLPAPEALDALARRFQDAEQRRRQLHDHRERLQLEQAQLDAQLAEVSGDAGAAEAHAARALREQAWQAHQSLLEREQTPRAELLEAARAFRRTLDEDDRLGDRRLLLAEQRGSAKEALASRAVKVSELEVLGRQLSEVNSTLESLEQSLQSVLEGLGLETANTGADWTVDRLQGWLARRAQVVREVNALHDLQRSHDAADARVKNAQEQLWRAMRDHTLEPSGQSFAHDLARVEEHIRGWQEAEQAHTSTNKVLDQAKQSFDDRQRHVERATTALADWQSEWADALSNLPVLGERSTVEPEEMTEILAVLDALTPQMAKVTETQAQVAQLVAAKERYQAEVSAIAYALELTDTSVDPLQLADQMRSRLHEARRIDQRRRDKEAAIETAETSIRQASAELETSTRRVAEMRQRFPSSDASELLLALQRAERRAADEERLAQLNQQITTRLTSPDLDSALQTLSDAFGGSGSADELRLLYDTHCQATEDANALVSTRYHNWQEARALLADIGDDGEVAQLNEQLRLLLLEIEQKSQRFVALSAGTQVVERALRVYMDTHRSSMLKRASDAFATITGGAFSGLEAMPAADRKSGDELVGLRGDGSSLPAKAMSKGSRFQLYLSLRIAGYHEFVSQREALPFFADDILETFDDRRSLATFGLMAEMATHGQVIYLTHHQHLCDLALQVTAGQAKIHTLPGPTG